MYEEGQMDLIPKKSKTILWNDTSVTKWQSPPYVNILRSIFLNLHWRYTLWPAPNNWRFYLQARSGRSLHRYTHITCWRASLLFSTYEVNYVFRQKTELLYYVKIINENLKLSCVWVPLHKDVWESGLFDWGGKSWQPRSRYCSLVQTCSQ